MPHNLCYTLASGAEHRHYTHFGLHKNFFRKKSEYKNSVESHKMHILLELRKDTEVSTVEIELETFCLAIV